MNAAAKSSDPSWTAFAQSLAKLPFHPGEVNERVSMLARRYFPMEAKRSSNEGLVASPTCYAKKWRIARALRSPCGSGLQAVLKRWRLVAMLQIYSRSCHRKSREKRRLRLQSVIDEACVAAKKHHMYGLYQAIRKLSPKKPRTKIKMTTSTGLVMSSQDEFVAILSYFRSLFMNEDAISWQIPYCSNCPITENDLVLSFKSLKPPKAVPRHYAPTAVWKLIGESLAPALYQYLCSNWSAVYPDIPVQWTSSWVILIPKAGRTQLRPEDLRPISLQDPIGKICLKAVVHRARELSLPQLVVWPLYAYIPQRGTLDAIYPAESDALQDEQV